MEGVLRTIDPDKHLFIWGAIKAEGFAEDDAIDIEELADLYETYRGVDGEITRIKIKNRGATLTLRLAESSPTNALLSVAREADKAGLGVSPLTVKGSGTGTYFAAKCWIKKSPKVVKGRKVNVFEWTFEIAKLDRFDGFVLPT